MTRHSKNCTANSVYSYHEKKKDSKSSGFGSLNLRYGKDGVKDFDCCSLSLHPCRDPVITLDGFLYDKEAILEYIVSKKNEFSRKLKEYEKQCNKQKAELKELCDAEQRSHIEKFLKNENGIKPSSSKSSDLGLSSGPSASALKLDKDKKLPSFWIPSLTPESQETKLPKPDKTVYCPMSGKPLRMKDLIPVKFTLAEKSSEGLAGKRERYKCPVSGDVLRNNVPCAVLKLTGDVVTMDVVQLIHQDMLHPLTGQKMTEKDIIPLQRGGTGFAETNEKLVGTKARPVLQS